MAGKPLNSPIVAMAVDPATGGYWLLGADGGVFDFGKARYSGSLGGSTLTSPVVGMASQADGAGYWLGQVDGVVTGFGGVPVYGDA